MIEVFDDRGLRIHAENCGKSGEALGFFLDGVNLRSSLTLKRLRRVRRGLRAACRRKRLTGQALEILVGHATFCGLSNRPLLSVFHTVYRFIERHYGEAAEVWPSIREELRAFAGLMTFSTTDWRLQWDPWVQSSDASEQGWGVAGASLPRGAVAKLGRVTEKLRFKRLPAGTSARERALGQAGFGEVGGR